MKSLLKMSMIALCAIAFTNCSTENDEITESENLSAKVEISAKEQTPNPTFDTGRRGIYHGVVAGKTGQNRGKIWINFGNNAKYDAYVEMINGDRITFAMNENFSANNESNKRYTFTGNTSSFKVTVSNTNEVEISDFKIFNEPYFGYAIKDFSSRRATSYTGTMQVPETNFSGTWNVLSNGVFDPNGNSGTAISDVMVTFNGNMYTDTSMEQSTEFQCLGAPNWVPIVDYQNSAGNGIIAVGQTSDFGGSTSWELIFEISQGGYYTNDGCQEADSGLFTWTNPANGNIKNGTILIDVI